MASNLRILVAAIDFGTTYPGWAFSFKHEYDADPTQVYAKRWIGGHLVSEKAPTIVLIKPDGKTLDSFGYEAETKYAELASEGNFHHEKWYYFRRFKMMLHERLGLTRKIQLEDETNKKTLPAKTVFSLAIRYLKDDMLTTSRGRLTGDEIRENEITWVLTVPAIWNDAAKQFMREAAVEAGIMNENLKIALEPETASIYCRLLPVEKMAEGAGVCSLKPGSKYMVLDAGGGTVDITVHEVMLGGKLKELHKASGGAWGGTQVDEAYKQFLIGLVGNPVFQRFCNEHKDDHLDMCRDFEVKKRDIAPYKDTTVTIRIPSSLKEIFQDETGEDLLDAIRQTGYAEKVSLMRDKLRVDASVMKDLFMKAIQETVSHLKELMKDTHLCGISSILMVGGFSDSKMLQNAVRSEFPSLRIIVPQEAGLVVLKGAVVFGHSPSSIAQRVCKYTYGVGTTHEFDALKHDKSKIKQYDIGPRCEDIFEKHVEIGQVVTLYETQSQTTYFPIQNDQKKIAFPIYYSTKKSPMYTTDEGVMKIGKIIVDILDMSVPLRKREFIVSMTFSGTEIEVSAKEIRTGRITKVSVDFLG
ncbi:hypothetical protein CHS0354_030542 [Potamilus streckersoni]|uniref:Heat shock 70 kDa protein 12A n=1 Tax=Potamilus streckersoni TaxID=2493646 RepID=A0AAE0RPI6_9BIVA|nr:hypothetical protein CHS0354_030542 [Potamilus streckersoni]